MRASRSTYDIEPPPPPQCALLFLTLDPITAAAALSVSLSMSFPLAWLFERSGNSVWPCALVHAVAQGAIKLIEVDPSAFHSLALAWMAIAALAPWSLFLLRPRAGRFGAGP